MNSLIFYCHRFVLLIFSPMKSTAIVDKVEDASVASADREKKKRRQRGRKSKQNNSSASESCSSVNGEASFECLANGTMPNHVTTSLRQQRRLGISPPCEQGLPKASGLAFISLPTMYIDESIDARSPVDRILLLPDKLQLWSLLKRKENLYSEARVMGLGPKFMSIYIQKLDVERQIDFDEVEGLMVEWLDATSTLVLSLCFDRDSFRRGSPGILKALDDVALVVNPCDLKAEDCLVGKSLNEPRSNGCCLNREVEPMIFPLTVRLLSTISVVLHAVGGDGPVDIGARLYMSSYIC